MDFELGKSYNQLQVGEQASGVKSLRKGRRWFCRLLKALSHYLAKRII